MKSPASLFTTVLSAAACFWLLPRALAINPTPDGVLSRIHDSRRVQRS